MPEEKVLVDHSAVSMFESRADELILSNNLEDIQSFCVAIDQENLIFNDHFIEARYLYTLANCYSNIYRYNSQEWYSDDLSRAVVNYRRALHAIKKIESPSRDQSYLQSCIETNLGNYLSSQGRCICCIQYWDDAFKRSKNPVSIISKANNQLFVAGSVYDPGHRSYHYFIAYNLINEGMKYIDHLHPEHQDAYSDDGKLVNFRRWFDENFQLEDFAYYEEYKEKYDTRKRGEYLKWCGENRLFINDLNDVCMSEIAHQDIMSLPTFSQSLNTALAMHEELVYHGNYDEIKNDYCYARYIFFSAKGVSSEQVHFFNDTYPHIDDMAHSITNIKASHYKSAFRTLYSIFDKIAYFLNRFLDLNDIQLDHKISFDSFFKELKGSKWQPHAKLKESDNCFIHALFYILKDLKDIKDSTSVSRWLDPDAKAFSEIRNAIEHRSLKIVDDFGYALVQSSEKISQCGSKNMNEEIFGYQDQLNKIEAELEKLSESKDDLKKSILDDKKEEIQKHLLGLQAKLYEKKKLSSHSILITESEFESRLMTLMKLARNSIMYLSLAIHFEEKNKLDVDGFVINRYIPLK